MRTSWSTWSRWAWSWLTSGVEPSSKTSPTLTLTVSFRWKECDQALVKARKETDQKQTVANWDDDFTFTFSVMKTLHYSVFFVRHTDVLSFTFTFTVMKTLHGFCQAHGCTLFHFHFHCNEDLTVFFCQAHGCTRFHFQFQWSEEFTMCFFFRHTGVLATRVDSRGSLWRRGGHCMVPWHPALRHGQYN